MRIRVLRSPGSVPQGSSFAGLVRAAGSGVRGPLGKTFAASGVIQGLNVLTGVALARGLGPHARGELAAILLWVMLVASAGQIGLPEAVTYHIAHDRRRASAIFGVALSACIVLSLGLMAVGALVVRFTLAHYGPKTLTIAMVFVATIPLYIGTNIGIAALQGLEAMTSFNLVRGLVYATTAAGLLALYLAHALTVGTASCCYIAGYAIPMAASFLVLVRMRVLAIRFDRQTLNLLLAYGIRSQTGFITQTLIQSLDQLLISIVLGATSLGLYVVAVTLSSGANLIASTVGLVAFPRIAALTGLRERAAAARRYLSIVIALCILLVVPMVLLTPQLLGLFFGRSFVEATDVCRVLLVASLFLAITYLLMSLLRGLGRPLDIGRAGAVGLVTTVVLLGALLPTIGLMGAAIASLAAYAVTAGMMLFRMTAALHISLPAFLLGAAKPSPSPLLRIEEAR